MYPLEISMDNATNLTANDCHGLDSRLKAE